MDYREPIIKGKCKPLTGYFDQNKEYFSLFEEGDPPKKLPIEKAQEKKSRIKKEKIVNHLVEQKDQIK